jgi:hypothetical protein
MRRHATRVLTLEFRAKRVGTESNPAAPVYVKVVKTTAPTDAVEVELTLPAGAYTVQAKANHWLRSEIRGVAAALNTSIARGNSCSLLIWSLADGYRVYRRVQAGQEELLTAQPIDDEIYADSGLLNGQEYRYRIVALDRAGRPVAFSGWIGVTPTSAAPLLNWSLAPTQLSENAVMHVRLSTGEPVAAPRVFVDDRLAGSGGLAANAPGDVMVTFDTTAFPNGSRAIKVAGYSGEYVAVTPVWVAVFNNPINAFTVTEAFEAGQSVFIRAALPEGTVRWRVDILRLLDDVVVRSHQGTGSIVDWAWDGRDSQGLLVDNDTYVVRITATDNQGQVYVQSKLTAKVSGFPNGLALIDSSQGRHIDCTALAKTIRSQWQRMRQNHPWFDFVVRPSRTVVGKDLKRKIWDWLRNSVTVFYLYGHGCGRTQNLPPVAYWGTINFWSELPQDAGIRRSLQQRPELRKTMHFIVPEITAGRQCTFAFMDACNTAAAHTNENPGREDDAFARAFNIGTNVNYSSCFAGWNGNSGAVSLQTTGGEWVAPSIWLHWRQRFWTLLGDGYYVSQAFTLACQRTPREPGINPHDHRRFTQWEDTTVP